MSTEQQFNIGDRVEWLGFVKANQGEAERPIGTIGTVTALGYPWSDRVNVAYVQWDGGSPIRGAETTWVENVRLVEPPAPVESDPGLRERMLAEAIRAVDYGTTPADIVVAAIAFEAYVTGGTK